LVGDIVKAVDAVTGGESDDGALPTPLFGVVGMLMLAPLRGVLGA
jgi:hypothetical protein